MRVLKILIMLFAVLAFPMSRQLLAIPTFQVYIVDGVAGSRGLDEDSWFTSNSSFNLIVVGNYGSETNTNTTALSEVTLLLSVPEGEVGTFSITGGDADLLTKETLVAGTSYYNPNAYADKELLTDESGNTGYVTKNFLPDGDFNDHYPLQDDVSDFLIYGLGNFNPVGEIHNYNADTTDPDYESPPILTDNSWGVEKTYSVEITGFSRVHFDVYGYETIESVKKLKDTWSIDPGSHDSTYIIPAPGAIFLGSIGVGLVGWLRRRRTL